MIKLLVNSCSFSLTEAGHTKYKGKKYLESLRQLHENTKTNIYV